MFVCTGNICRSPTAEGVFRAHVERAGLAPRILADSCGTHDYHVGEPPDPRSQQHALRRGYDLSELRARRIRDGDFAAFDLLLALDRDHQKILSRMAPPAARGKVRLLLDYAPALGRAEVPDPYYGGPNGFEHVLDLIEAASAGLLAALRTEIE
ncbi:MAG: low molecular weight phosphotyrosine protein phosphatase [Rhodospirillales bacterium]|nr:low molecular weight phosphotyrosine protein phosphatase [Rhodospirillales bacterium]